MSGADKIEFNKAMDSLIGQSTESQPAAIFLINFGEENRCKAVALVRQKMNKNGSDSAYLQGVLDVLNGQSEFILIPKENNYDDDLAASNPCPEGKRSPSSIDEIFENANQSR